MLITYKYSDVVQNSKRLRNYFNYQFLNKNNPTLRFVNPLNKKYSKVGFLLWGCHAAHK